MAALAVACGDKVEVAGFIRVHDSLQCRHARQGDGGRRQTIPRVGIVRRVGTQVATPDVAVEGIAHAIDHRGICLQAHALAQALDEHTGDTRPLVGAPCFLLDDRGQDQRLVRAVQWQAFIPCFPGDGKLLLHGRMGTLQELDVRGSTRKVIGIRQEATLGVFPGKTEQRHDLVGIIRFQRPDNHVTGTYGVQHFAKCLSLDHRQ